MEDAKNLIIRIHCVHCTTNRKITFAFLFSDKVPLAITDVKESLQKMEFTEEDLIHLDELKNYFENDDLPEVKESQIYVLGMLTQMSLNS